MKKLIIFMIFLALCGCSQKEVSELDIIIKENNYIIVDVRTKEEFASGHVVNAINIPLDDLESTTFDKTKTIIVYCKSGRRSALAYEKLTSLGIKAFDLGSYDSITLGKE